MHNLNRNAGSGSDQQVSLQRLLLRYQTFVFSVSFDLLVLSIAG